jgi:hypothetical protein
MAILSFYEVQVRVNDVALQEYDDDDSEQTPDPATPPTVVKYVEAISGAEFSIKSKIRSGWNQDGDLACEISLDGNKVKSYVHSRERYLEGNDSKVIEGVDSGSGSDWHRRKFKFADIVTGESLSVLRAASFESIQGTLRII